MQAVEQIVEMPLENGRTFQGKLDLIDSGTLIDYKGVADPDHFIQSHEIGFQIELYALAAAESLGVTIGEIEYRLVTRPSIKFCKKDKTEQDYAMRCYEWLTEKPERLRTHAVAVNETSREQALEWINGIATQIQDNRLTNRWTVNPGACHAYGRSCPFIPLCRAVKYGEDTAKMLEEWYQKRKYAHSELESKNQTVITHSSASTFADCAAKYFWRYEQLLEKRREDTAESLYVGSAIHAGFEALASEGLVEAYTAIDMRGKNQHVIGQDAHRKKLEMLAKARAMVRAAADRWKCD